MESLLIWGEEIEALRSVSEHGQGSSVLAPQVTYSAVVWAFLNALASGV